MPDRQEQWQKVEDLNQTENVGQTPPQPGNFWVSNLLQRVWSSLFGWGPSGPTRIGATSDGRLKVATTQGGFSQCEVVNATSTAAWVTYTFPNVAGQVDFMVNAYQAYIKTSADGVTYGDSVWVAAGTVWSPPVAVHSFQLEDATTAGHANIQAVGYF